MNNNELRGDFFRSLLTLHSKLPVQVFENCEQKKVEFLLYNSSRQYSFNLFLCTDDIFQNFIGFPSTLFTPKNKSLTLINYSLLLNTEQDVNKEYLDDILEFKTYLGLNNSFDEILSLDYNNYIDQLNKNNLELLNKNIEALPNRAVTQFDRELDRLNRRINEALNTISENREKIRIITGKKITTLLNPNNEYLNKLFKFLSKCPYINSYRVCDELISIHTNILPVTNTCGEELAIKYINSNYKNQEVINILTDSLTSRTKYALCITPINIELYINDNLDYAIEQASTRFFNRFDHRIPDTNTPVAWSCLVNYHWHYYNCLGDFKSDIHEAQSQYNPLRLVMLILQYLQTINLSDYAGARWLTAHQHLILDKETNNYLLIYNNSIIHLDKDYISCKPIAEYTKGE